jgi:hypothetical protein
MRERENMNIYTQIGSKINNIQKCHHVAWFRSSKSSQNSGFEGGGQTECKKEPKTILKGPENE